MFVCVVVLIYRPSSLTFWLNFCMLCEQSVPLFLLATERALKNRYSTPNKHMRGGRLSLCVCRALCMRVAVQAVCMCVRNVTKKDALESRSCMICFQHVSRLAGLN